MYSPILDEMDLRPIFHTRGQGRSTRLTPHEIMNQRAIRAARRLREMDERMGGTTTNWVEALFINGADYSAYNASSAEGSLLAGTNQQPVLPAFYFDGKAGGGVRRSILLKGFGVLGTTSTPTFTFQIRMGTTVGSSYLSGASVGVSAAITCASGVTNKLFYFEHLLTCYTPGLGSSNTTISGAGWIASPGGFGTPFTYPVEITTPDTATWTQTIDCSVTQYINVSGTWSASSSSNTATLKNLVALGLN